MGPYGWFVRRVSPVGRRLVIEEGSISHVSSGVVDRESGAKVVIRYPVNVLDALECISDCRPEFIPFRLLFELIFNPLLHVVSVGRINKVGYLLDEVSLYGKSGLVARSVGVDGSEGVDEEVNSFVCWVGGVTPSPPGARGTWLFAVRLLVVVRHVGLIRSRDSWR